MTSTTPLIFYDLAGSPTAPLFSPATTQLRFALLAKGVPFTVREITYMDLRRDWCGKDKPLGVEDATVPFIQLSDGTYMMDSLVIAPWLDEAYPNVPSVFLPTAPLPIDTKAPEYVAALEDATAFRKSNRWPGLFNIYGPRIIKTFDEEDATYFTCDARMGAGTWERIAASNYETSIASLKEQVSLLEAKLVSPDGFFTSATVPGFKDFHILGMHRMLASTDASGTKRVFDGKIGAWVERMRARFPDAFAAVEKRDPLA